MDSFFTTEDDRWFSPTSHSRGPWHVDHCHAGPPTALAVRALERLLPTQRLTRITVDLLRPIPHAGFSIDAEVIKSGRGVSRAVARLRDADDREVTTVTGLYMLEFPAMDLPTHAEVMPAPGLCSPGTFPIARPLHSEPTFIDAVEVKYPDGEAPTPGPTSVWMRTVPILPDEDPTPFQRICPLGDCGNAFGRNMEATEISFVNPDLIIVLHRDPEGEWLGMQAAGYWQENGIGMSDAALFDRHGCVGRALQTLYIRPH